MSKTYKGRTGVVEGGRAGQCELRGPLTNSSTSLGKSRETLGTQFAEQNTYSSSLSTLRGMATQKGTFLRSKVCKELLVIEHCFSIFPRPLVPSSEWLPHSQFLEISKVGVCWVHTQITPFSIPLASYWHPTSSTFSPLCRAKKLSCDFKGHLCVALLREYCLNAEYIFYKQGG